MLRVPCVSTCRRSWFAVLRGIFSPVADGLRGLGVCRINALDAWGLESATDHNRFAPKRSTDPTRASANAAPPRRLRSSRDESPHGIRSCEHGMKKARLSENVPAERVPRATSRVAGRGRQRARAQPGQLRTTDERGSV